MIGRTSAAGKTNLESFLTHLQSQNTIAKYLPDAVDQSVVIPDENPNQSNAVRSTSPTGRSSDQRKTLRRSIALKSMYQALVTLGGI